MYTFCKNFKNLRLDFGLSQLELAERLSVSRSTIGAWERGHTEPSLAMLEGIATFFNVDVNELLGSDPRNMSGRELKLIKVFKKLNEQSKQYLEIYLDGLLQGQNNSPSSANHN